MCLSNCLLKRFIFYSWTSFAQYRTKGSRLVRPKSWSTEKLKRGSTTSCPPSTQGAKRTLRTPNVNSKTHVTKSNWHGADLRKHKTNFVTVTLIHKFVIWMTWIVIKKILISHSCPYSSSELETSKKGNKSSLFFFSRGFSSSRARITFLKINIVTIKFLYCYGVR